MRLRDTKKPSRFGLGSCVPVDHITFYSLQVVGLY